MWRRFLADRAGNVTILAAAGIGVSVIIAAFAVDAAALYHERRLLQSAVDLAAIAAARDPENGLEIARQTLVEAGLVDAELTLDRLGDPESPVRLAAVAGRYTADPDLSVSERFAPGAGANALRVYAQKPGRLYFAKSWSPVPTLAASATAAVTPRVGFSIGSRLLRLEGGIANAVLNRLLGTSVSLTALDYNGIANAQIDAFHFLDALALELDITAGTYADVLVASANQNQIARALAATLSGAEATVAGAIAAAVGGGNSVGVGKLIDLGDLAGLALGSGGDDLFADLSALDLLAASAVLADGAKQLGLNLTAGIPGLAGISLELAVGEPPQSAWFTVGEAGAVVRTAQVRLRLDIRLLGGSGLLGAGVHLPVYVEIAPAEAIVASATCPSPENPRGTATILARPGVARLAIGAVSDASFGAFNTPPHIGEAEIVDVLLLEITGSALVEIAQTEPRVLEFSSSDIAAGRTETAKTTTPLDSLAASLLGELDLDIRLLGLGLGSVSAITKSLEALLAPVAPVLDVILAELLEALGLSLGEADVKVHGIVCSHPVLVQ